jgi:hypothetical protein
MAGGDIAPVEPVVEAPAPVASGWEFSGNAVGYYQTIDAGIAADLGDAGTVGYTSDLFDSETAQGNFGVQLRAANKDVVAGIGAGIEVNGLTELPFVADWYAQNPTNDPAHAGGWISQAYLTYGFGNTSIKVGRQTLPKGLSPFAFSEDWNVFPNTFDAALVVNTDITDTALVYAFVKSANNNSGLAMNQFNDFPETDGVHMLTVQNKSIANLTLTGTWYYSADFADGINDLNILWGDAAYDAGSFNVAVQGGQVTHDAFDNFNGDHTSFGAKVGAKVGPVNAQVAYSTVNDGGFPGVATGGVNLGGTTSALYTTTVADQLLTAQVMNYDADKWLVKGNMDALGGNICAAYAMTQGNDLVLGDTNEFDLTYSANLTDNFGVSATYANIDQDVLDTMDVVRVIANYKF